jgi:hypothetical protein
MGIENHEGIDDENIASAGSGLPRARNLRDDASEQVVRMCWCDSTSVGWLRLAMETTGVHASQWS